MESFGKKDSDFLFDPSIIKPNDVIPILRKVPYPEEVHLMWFQQKMKKPRLIFDGSKWKPIKVPEAVTITLITPLSHYALDLVFGKPRIDFHTLWKRSKKALYFGTPIRIASKDDILKLKSYAGREKDIMVIKRLKNKFKKRK